MKKLFIMVAVLSLTACGTSKIPGYDGPKALDRPGVIQGARDCINARMKPNVEYLSQKTEHGVTMVPVNVHCEVYTTK